MSEDRQAQAAREEMARVVRRLNVLEYIILGGILLLALLGGALLAFLLQTALGLPFRLMWMMGSLLFFVVPGVIVLGRERKWGKDRLRSEHGERHDDASKELPD